MKIRFLKYCFLILLPSLLSGQDPEFSQFFSNPLYLNPAFTGTSNLTRVAFNYRNQWPQNGATYETYSMSIDSYLEKMRGGLGLQVYHDRQFSTVVNYTSTSVFYSYAISFTEELVINTALQAGLEYKQINTDDLVFPSMINQVNGDVTGSLPDNFIYESRWYPDFAFGFIGKYTYEGVKKKKWPPHNYIYGGFSIHHLNRPEETSFNGGEASKIPLKIRVQLGNRMYWRHSFPTRLTSLSPNFSYLHQGSFKQLNSGLSVTFESLNKVLAKKETNLTFGLWYRNNISLRTDALIFLTGFSFEKFYAGYSFDFTLSKMSNYSYGSQEISIIYLLGNDNCIKTKPKNKILFPLI